MYLQKGEEIGKSKDEETRNFIEQATNDLSVARKVAAYAVSIVAKKYWLGARTVIIKVGCIYIDP